MTGAVVLAAGCSTRMGTQKLLLPYDGMPLIRHVVQAVLRGPVAEVIVVTGHSRHEVERALEGLIVGTIYNNDYQAGMLSSVRAGIRALRDGLAPMVVLGDQPAVPLPVLREIEQRHRQNPEAIIVPVSEGRRGHPIVVPARFRPEVLAKHDDVGLRGLLRQHAGDVEEVAVNAPGILIDLDTPADYAAAIRDLHRPSGRPKT